MIDLNLVLLILLGHFVADFICQSDYHAINKSKSNLVLGQHVLVYMSVMSIIVGILFPINLVWCIINLIGHFVTDFCTSRLTGKLWVANQRHWFFVAIGFDQLIHYITLLTTYNIFVS